MSVRIYIRDKGDPKSVREYGTDHHHSLQIQEDGSLQFYHFQNGEGTGKDGGYEFCRKDGSLPEDETLDMGGEFTGINCWCCKYRERPQKCSCCKRNADIKDCYELDEAAVAEFKRQLFESSEPYW